jgi:hypothetical protein
VEERFDGGRKELKASEGRTDWFPEGLLTADGVEGRVRIISTGSSLTSMPPGFAVEDDDDEEEEEEETVWDAGVLREYPEVEAALRSLFS